jgi:hypothetical protein
MQQEVPLVEEAGRGGVADYSYSSTRLWRTAEPLLPRVGLVVQEGQKRMEQAQVGIRIHLSAGGMEQMARLVLQAMPV